MTTSLSTVTWQLATACKYNILTNFEYAKVMDYIIQGQRGRCSVGRGLWDD